MSEQQAPQERDEGSVDYERTWEVGLEREAFLQLSREESFRVILVLCRLVNLMRFVQAGVIGNGGSSSPFARRQSSVSLSFFCALLYEAHTKVLPRIGKHYGTRKDYQDGLGAWHASPEVRAFIRDNCKELRRTATFHVDVRPIPGRLARIKSDWTRVMTSRGTMQGFYYYDLADTIAMMAFWGDLESAGDVDARVNEFSERAGVVTLRFINAADELIASVIAEPPFQQKQGEDTEEPDWLRHEMEREGRIPGPAGGPANPDDQRKPEG